MTLEQLLTLQWNDEKMVKHCLTNCLYIQSGDAFISVGTRKPSIDRNMWYDDETAGPEANFRNFKDYNMRLHAPRLVGDKGSNALYITVNYHGDKTGGRLLALTTYNRDTRLATNEEIRLANLALAEARRDYEKRLATYWKRYSDKVHARGYWANR